MKRLKKIGIEFYLGTFLIVGLLGGCGGSSVPCSIEDIRSGTFCYDGHDFGKNPNPDYRQGVRDGCKTGKGHFSKDYTISNISIQYRQGWLKGRATCRPSGWSDHPTYSYHPLPSSERNSSVDANHKGTGDSSNYIETKNSSDKQNNSNYNDNSSNFDTQDGESLFDF